MPSPRGSRKATLPKSWARCVSRPRVRPPTTWGAELARGDGRGRIYIVEPTGPFDDDPNLTDQRFHGNKTASYRSVDPLRITGEVDSWVGHPPQQVRVMKESLARMARDGTSSIIED
ncbi:NAD(+)--rifampin ADP-ribosyltransferase [Flavisphingomonas formosensis]|uniref:NAD(+)--rifampin ADP-ribosyltransferase n=1 Tax=Flavisphingomonas formosensis TaxID=861534 RepID=UPI0012F97E58|nr:NAD(+)--rifampin ADP-ribosyltransferase [Sphingomonas formosensis]